MASPLRVYLMRHGESAANLDRGVNMALADHAVPLSPVGHEQALAAGHGLAVHMLDGRPAGTTPETGITAYVSPYRRTRQTWAAARTGLLATLAPGTDIPATESIFLRELVFGLFDGVPDEDLAATYPREHAHYEKNRAHGGEFYARMPSGESRCDVAQRVHQFFGTLHRDHERHGVTDAIVVSHGVTIRAFRMMWLDLSPEWMEAAPNPDNCSVHHLCGGIDLGLVHAGGPRHHSAQDLREAGVVE